MTDKHTPEPWAYRDNSIHQPDGGEHIAYTDVDAGVDHRSDGEHEANAHRIVACVNACAGVPTGELEEAARSGQRLWPPCIITGGYPSPGYCNCEVCRPCV